MDSHQPICEIGTPEGGREGELSTLRITWGQIITKNSLLKRTIATEQAVIGSRDLQPHVDTGHCPSLLMHDKSSANYLELECFVYTV